MKKTNVEILYEWLDNTAGIIQQHVNEPYLDSLIYTMEILFEKHIPEDLDEVFSQKLQNNLDQVDITSYKTEEIRKGIQLAVLKGMKDSTQQQHLMTPETVALLVGYLAEKLTADKEEVRLFDPAGGTGNLVTTVMEHLKEKKLIAFAGEVDPTLIQLAVLSANLQQKSIEFFHQDSLRPFLLDPVDLIIADLPVGYYPDDVQADTYELKAENGNSYAHHLFIEQAMNYTKPGGYLIFVVPDFIFNSDQSDKLHAYLQEHSHITGVIRLPESAFKSEKNIKSILVLQKKGQDTRSPKQPLLAQMPSFKNTTGMSDILNQMNDWFVTYQKEMKGNE